VHVARRRIAGYFFMLTDLPPGDFMLVGAKHLPEMESAIADARSASTIQEPANNSGAKGG
jgi:hypothetical protein